MILQPLRLQSLIELDQDASFPAPLSDFVYATLKHRILTCALTPGQNLNEKELSIELKVSRTPLREALNRLVNEGLVCLISRRGYLVAPITAEDISQLFEVRRIVESETAALAATRATPEEIERLASLSNLSYQPGVRQTYQGYLRANSAFHLALAQCSHNRRLEAIVMAVLDQLQRPMYLGLDFGFKTEDATAEHSSLVEAIKARDPVRAAAIINENFDHTMAHIVAGLRAAGF